MGEGSPPSLDAVRSSITVALMLALVVTGCGRSTQGKSGAELFEISCADCHGASGEGGLVGPAIGTADSSAARLTDAQIFGAIRVGPGAMPGNPRLTDAQIDSLVELLRELQEGP